jgi:hypothetical protein
MSEPVEIRQNGRTRQPKGDHNRRLSLGIDAARFAAEAGITPEALKDYETTGPDHRFDARVAQRVGETLDRLEAILPNSQTGRQRPAGNARVDDVGRLLGLPRLDSIEESPDWPRYGPAGDE